MFSLMMMKVYATETTDSIIMDQIDGIGSQMVNTIEYLDMYGPPGRNTIEFYFPPKIVNMSVIDDHLIIFEFDQNGHRSTLGYYTEVKVNADFTESDFTEGHKNFRFQSVAIGEVNVSRWLR